MELVFGAALGTPLCMGLISAKRLYVGQHLVYRKSENARLEELVLEHTIPLLVNGLRCLGWDVCVCGCGCMSRGHPCAVYLDYASDLRYSRYLLLE